MAGAQDLGFDDDAAAFLGTEVGARQEHRADRDATALDVLAARVADVFLEEILRDFDVDAGAVTGLAVGVDGAAMPYRLQGIDARHDDVTATLAVQCHDQADAAGIGSFGGVVAIGIGEALRAFEILRDEFVGGHGHTFPTPPALRAASPSEWEGQLASPVGGGDARV